MSRLTAALLGILAITTGSCQRTRGVRIRDVTLATDRVGSPHIGFEVRWPGGRTSAPGDALWVFAKLRMPDGRWRHARLVPERTTAGGQGVSVEPATDGSGAFVRNERPRGAWVPLTLALAQDPHAVTAARVFAVEMVWVEPGPFFVGDGEVVQVHGHFQTAATGSPFHIRSEAALTLGQDSLPALTNSNGYGMRGDPDEPFIRELVADDFNNASRLVLPSAFPKGVTGFYVMKHELDQAAYAGFLNTLTPDQARRRDPGIGLRTPGAYRYAVTTTRPHTALVPDRAMNQVSWMDAAAYADWAGLRPMTELEFEKAARGANRPVTGQFSWGTDVVAGHRYVVRGTGTPLEIVSNPDSDLGNASWRGTHGEDRPGCASCITGPVPVGAFAALDGPASGASPVGVFELSGNLHERVVTTGHAAGRRFDGSHGDGQLAPSGNAGGPEIALWPGSRQLRSGFEIVGALGTGLRGGSWASPRQRLRISDRALAATADTIRSPTVGIRLVRSAPVQRR